MSKYYAEQKKAADVIFKRVRAETLFKEHPEYDSIYLDVLRDFEVSKLFVKDYIARTIHIFEKEKKQDGK